MMQRMKVGIAGYGVVGKRRRQFLDMHPAVETVAVCDQKFDGEGRLPDGVLYFDHYKKLLTQDIDILFVCLTNDVAAETTIAGLENGLHVFCEKPPGRDISDIVRVLEYKNNHLDLKLKYGFNHRYHYSVRDALALVRSGDLGHVINLRGVYGKSKIIAFDQDDWRSKRAIAGGGILLDQGIHMVDLLRLFGGEFKNIHSFIRNDFWNHDVEDNAYALMQSETGVVAMLHSSATQWRHRFNLEIALARGTLILSGILSGSKSYGAETLTVVFADPINDAGDPKEQTTRYNEDNSWKDEIADFMDAILDDREITDGSGEDALKTMQMVYRIYCADDIWKKTYGLSQDIE
jgi:predicted dehydrogenase